MEILGEPTKIKLSELRSALNVAPATMAELCTKAGIGKGEPRKPRKLEPEEVHKILSYKKFSFPRPARVKTIMTGKGGVGKTNSTYALGCRLAAYGAKVLLIDSDPSGNLTSALLEMFGIELTASTTVLADVFDKSRHEELESCLIHIYKNMHLIPSTPVNSVLENRIRENYKNFYKPMRSKLEKIKKNYDFVLIDCGPTLNIINTVMMYSADHLIIPINPDSFARIGLEQTINEIDEMRKDFENWNPKVSILFTRFDAREYTSMKYLSSIAEDFQDVLLTSTIGVSSAFKNAFDQKVSLFEMKGKQAQKSIHDYDSLTREIIGMPVS